MNKFNLHLEKFKFSSLLNKICTKIDILNPHTLAGLMKPKYANKLKEEIVELVKSKLLWDEFFIKSELQACEWIERVSKEDLFLLVPFGPTLEACSKYFAEKLAEDFLFFVDEPETEALPEVEIISGNKQLNSNFKKISFPHVSNFLGGLLSTIKTKYPILHGMIDQVGKFRYPQLLHDFSLYTKLATGRRYHNFSAVAFPLPAPSTASKDLAETQLVKESVLQVIRFFIFFFHF